MRLVDADALIANEVHTIVRLTATGEQMDSVVYAEDIDNAPTIDAVQVVRCKDCVHYHKADRGHPDTDWCKRLICGTIKPDFFCADGERKSK